MHKLDQPKILDFLIGEIYMLRISLLLSQLLKARIYVDQAQADFKKLKKQEHRLGKLELAESYYTIMWNMEKHRITTTAVKMNRYYEKYLHRTNYHLSDTTELIRTYIIGAGRLMQYEESLLTDIKIELSSIKPE